MAYQIIKYSWVVKRREVKICTRNELIDSEISDIRVATCFVQSITTLAV